MSSKSIYLSFQWIDFRQDSEDENPLEFREALPQGGEEVVEQVGLCAHVLPVFLF